MATREYLADYWCGECGVIVRLVPHHPLAYPDDEPFMGEDEGFDEGFILECPVCAGQLDLRQLVGQRKSANESDKAAETIPIVGEEGA